MAANFNWTVMQKVYVLEIGNRTNIVNDVHWRCDASEGNNSIRMEGCAHIPYIEDNTFIPAEELEDSDVLSWMTQTKSSVEQEMQLKLSEM